jgi:hypothetical protein
MDNLLIVDVPEGVHEYVLQQLPEHGLSWLHFLNERGGDVARPEELHGNYWELVGRGDQITEEGAAKILGKFMNGEGSYYYFYPGSERFAHAIASLHSWIRSQGKEPKTSIILKKEI